MTIRTSTRTRTAALAALLVACFLAPGCGQHHMVATDDRIRQHSMAGEHERALQALQASKNQGFKEQDSVLYWMNEGMLLHLSGRHRQAIAALDLADRRSKELFTRSASRQVQAVFTSNAALDYQGEDYEKVLINVVKALSFLALRDREGALVEARKTNHKLSYINEVHAEHPNAYREDAFAHWLIGMLFELEGSHDDARIAFANAERVYREQFTPRYGVAMPSFVAEDLARAATLSGDLELRDRLRRETGIADLGHTAKRRASHGEVVVVHLSGVGPTKTQFDVTCRFRDHIPNGCSHQPGGDYMIERTLDQIDDRSGESTVTVAFPRMVTEEPQVASISVRAHGIIEPSLRANDARAATAQLIDPYADATNTQTIETVEVAEAAELIDAPAAATPLIGVLQATSEVVLPIDRIAHETMRDKLPRIFRQAVIRAVAKAGSRKAANQAEKEMKGRGKATGVLGFAMSLATDVATTWTEEADKRTWTTLPARIEVARLWLPAGTHEVEIRLPSGKTRRLSGVAVEAGQRVFVTHRTIP